MINISQRSRTLETKQKEDCVLNHLKEKSNACFSALESLRVFLRNMWWQATSQLLDLKNKLLGHLRCHSIQYFLGKTEDGEKTGCKEGKSTILRLPSGEVV